MAKRKGREKTEKRSKEQQREGLFLPRLLWSVDEGGGHSPASPLEKAGLGRGGGRGGLSRWATLCGEERRPRGGGGGGGQSKGKGKGQLGASASLGF